MKSNMRPAIVVSHIVEVIMLICGSVLSLVFIPVTLYELSEELEDGLDIFAVFLLMAALGVWLIYRGISRRRLRKQFRLFVLAGSTHGDWSMERLASGSGYSVDYVRKQIERMVRLKFFGSGWLDKEKDCLVFPDLVQKTPDVDEEEADQADKVDKEDKADKPEKIVVVCKHCGASKVMKKGSIDQCDYCRCMLQG